MENLSINQKKEIGFIAVRGSIASCDFNTKINSAIKRTGLYLNEGALFTLNEYITSFKKHLIEYLDILDYRVLELSYEMFTIDTLMTDMRNIDCLVNDEMINFISLLVAFTEKILKIRNSIYALGCDYDSCKKSIAKKIKLLICKTISISNKTIINLNSHRIVKQQREVRTLTTNDKSKLFIGHTSY